MPDDLDVDLPIFVIYPGLLNRPPTLRYRKGEWVLGWSWSDDNQEVIVILNAFITARPAWSYAIYNKETNTIQHYAGEHADPTKDRQVTLEQGKDL